MPAVKKKVHFVVPTPGMVQNSEQLNIDDARKRITIPRNETKATPDEEQIQRNSIRTRSGRAINMPARFKNLI